MYNYDVYRSDLIIYIITVLIVATALFAAGNVLLLILKLTKIFSERKVWILVNLVGIAILIATIAPVCLDISQASYCEIPNVVSIEVLNSKYNDEILLTDSSGQVFSCRGDLIGDDALQDLEYPVVIICAKHSKLILGVYPPTSPE